MVRRLLDRIIPVLRYHMFLTCIFNVCSFLKYLVVNLVCCDLLLLLFEGVESKLITLSYLSKRINSIRWFSSCCCLHYITSHAKHSTRLSELVKKFLTLKIICFVNSSLICFLHIIYYKLNFFVFVFVSLYKVQRVNSPVSKKYTFSMRNFLSDNSNTTKKLTFKINS